MNLDGLLYLLNQAGAAMQQLNAELQRLQSLIALKDDQIIQLGGDPNTPMKRETRSD